MSKTSPADPKIGAAKVKSPTAQKEEHEESSVKEVPSSVIPTTADTQNREIKRSHVDIGMVCLSVSPRLRVGYVLPVENQVENDVKTALSLSPRLFSHWLMDVGLTKASQWCAQHSFSSMQIVMHTGCQKFPDTDDRQVWHSSCCPEIMVSLLYNSVFEGLRATPTTTVRLIFYWAHQAQLRDVKRWLQVEDTTIAVMYTRLRAICSLTLQKELDLFGGAGMPVEIGLLTIAQRHRDMPRMDVLIAYDCTLNLVRMRVYASEKQRSSYGHHCLMPLQYWVHGSSTLHVHSTVSVDNLKTMGFTHIVQVDQPATMSYLRHVLAAMLRNISTALTVPELQLLFDELAWRECYGANAAQAFQSILEQIGEQTTANSFEPLLQRLQAVVENP